MSAVVLGLAACGGSNAADTGSTGAGSGNGNFGCDYKNYQNTMQHWCWTWSWNGVDLTSTYSGQCTQGGGTPVSSCNTSGAVGKCDITASSGPYSVNEEIVFYPPVTAMTGQQSCMSSGGAKATWTAL